MKTLKRKVNVSSQIFEVCTDIIHKVAMAGVTLQSIE